MFISVVMAVYNGEKYVQEAINSILSQTYPEFELIIVDDGSTDQTRGILDAIHDHRVKIIHAERNQGAAASLNLGIDHAQGQWIAIHDADDVSAPTRLQDQVKYLQAHPESIGVSSLISGIFENEKNYHLEIDYYNTILSQRQIVRSRLFRCYLCHGSVVYSKQAFYDVGRYNPKYKISYDYDLWVRLFEIAPIQKIPKVLYHYRLRPTSLGKTNTKNTNIELVTISTAAIYNKLRQQKKTQPLLAIIGSRRGCQFFKKNVSAKFRKIRAFPVQTRSDLSKIYRLYKSGKIHAIVVLNNRKSKAIYNYFLKKGFRDDKNLYKIWNYRF